MSIEVIIIAVLVEALAGRSGSIMDIRTSAVE